jgi:regulator of sigma E protease
MTDFLTMAFSIVVVLGLMVLVHEFGHFIVAKSFGVQVDIFSIGFGPRLFGWKRGDTDYRVSALPVGGYVKMAGDNPAENRAGAPGEFLSKPRWQRLFIVLAGPTMNLITTLVLLAGLFTVAMPRPAYFDKPAEVVAVPKDSPVEKAGVRPGDRLVEIDGIKNPDWEKAETAVQTAPAGSEIHMTFEREGQTFPVTLRAAQLTQLCDQYSVIGYPPDPVVVDQLMPGAPAERSGMRSDDQIVGADGQAILSWCQFQNTIERSQGHPLTLQVRRGDQMLRLQVHPAPRPPNAILHWQVGFTQRQTLTYASMPVTQAVQRAGWVSLRLTQQILYLVGDLFRGRVSLKQVSGPIGIMRESGRAAKRGLADVIYVMAILSLNLGILNLLPIPILDGGHILMLAIEGSLRRDLSLKMKERFVQVGMVFLLVVFAIVMYNDVLRMIPTR